MEQKRLLSVSVDAGDALAAAIVKTGEIISADFVTVKRRNYGERDRRIDRLVTGRVLGYPLMLLLLARIFYITVVGANYPSQWLAAGLFWVESQLSALLLALGVSDCIRGALVDGAWRGLAQVVAVMLPPMAIFFPLFTLLEDLGYLPRIAYNLDSPFKRCGSCGKQALTMAMGFGCNAAGVVGCRIIDSPRERRPAILTNSLVPCNGRFPAMMLIIGTFFASSGGFFSAALPIAAMVYSSYGSLGAAGEASALGAVLIQNGWTGKTAVCFIIFSLMHWPCSTTLLTIRRETGSKWMTFLAALIPTAAGFICCFAVGHLAEMI